MSDLCWPNSPWPRNLIHTACGEPGAVQFDRDDASTHRPRASARFLGSHLVRRRGSSGRGEEPLDGLACLGCRRWSGEQARTTALLTKAAICTLKSTEVSMSLHDEYAQVVKQFAGRDDLASERELQRLMWALAAYRSKLIANTILRRDGSRVQNGPFAGMHCIPGQTWSNFCNYLLGSYEADLHPHLVAFSKEELDVIIDIGCAEGYYAVGMALLCPSVQVFAHDISKTARAACLKMAEKNGVERRFSVGGEFTGSDFSKFTDVKTLLIMDVEGAELDLLDPALFPALKAMSIIVETHNMYRPNVTNILIERFRETHDVQVIKTSTTSVPVPEWLSDLGQLDQMIAVWEMRSGETPWLVMRPL